MALERVDGNRVPGNARESHKEKLWKYKTIENFDHDFSKLYFVNLNSERLKA